MTKQLSLAAVSGRKQLKSWLEKAQQVGTIYYVMRRHSEFSTDFSFHRIDEKEYSSGTFGKKIELEILPLWPKPHTTCYALQLDNRESYDLIAKDWGFSYKTRTFRNSVVGTDRCYDTIDTLARKAGFDEKFMQQVKLEAI
jgi:hypothetical protein